MFIGQHLIKIRKPPRRGKSHNQKQEAKRNIYSYKASWLVNRLHWVCFRPAYMLPYSLLASFPSNIPLTEGMTYYTPGEVQGAASDYCHASCYRPLTATNLSYKSQNYVQQIHSIHNWHGLVVTYHSYLCWNPWVPTPATKQWVLERASNFFWLQPSPRSTLK